VFASKVWNAAGQDGLIHGNAKLLFEQLVGVAASAAYAGIGTLVLLKVLEKVMGLRATKDEEQEGLDAIVHGEESYALAEGPGARALVEESPLPASKTEPAVLAQESA
jgi:ammonium transporter, Amt family